MKAKTLKKLLAPKNQVQTTSEPQNISFQISSQFDINLKDEFSVIKEKQAKQNKESLTQIRQEKEKLERELKMKNSELEELVGNDKTIKNLKKKIGNQAKSLESRIKQIEAIISNKEKDTEINALDIQYYKVYHSRVMTLKKLYRQTGPIVSIASLSSNINQTVRIVGVISKKMTKYVSYLKQIEEPDFEDLDEKKKTSLFGKLDTVFIEDETGRIEISPQKGDEPIQKDHWISFFENLHPVSLTTGTVVCAKGFLDNNGIFHLSKFEFMPLDRRREFCEQINFNDESNTILEENQGNKNTVDLTGNHKNVEPRGDSREFNVSFSQTGGNENQIAIISCFEFSIEILETDRLKNLRELFTESIFPNINIKALVLMGNLFQIKPNLNICVVNKYQYKEDIEDLVEKQTVLAHYLDLVIEEFLSADPERICFISPGHDDPTSTFLPQERFKDFMFEKSHSTGRLFLLNNPAFLKINDKKILISDGKNLRDYKLQSDLEIEELARLEMLTQHVFHTCPNSLPLFPFSKSDPMILRDGLPDYYLIAGENQFAEDLMPLSSQGNLNRILEENEEGEEVRLPNGNQILIQFLCV